MKPGIAPNDDRYLSLRELAKYAGISVRTLRKYVARSHNPLPHYRMNGIILVKRTEFDGWMEQFHVERAESVDDTVDELMEALR